MQVHSDGGAIIYINGIEAVRDNMPAGPIAFDTLSLSDSGEGIFERLPDRCLAPRRRQQHDRRRGT